MRSSGRESGIVPDIPAPPGALAGLEERAVPVPDQLPLRSWASRLPVGCRIPSLSARTERVGGIHWKERTASLVRETASGQ